MTDDRRLIEDYLPIREISAEASREKSVRKGHISTLHLWWARRPLVACRAAVYGALVPATQFQPENGPEEKRASLGRANAQKFVSRLCKYPGDPEVIKQAQRHILDAHAERLTKELEDTKEGGKRPAWADEYGFTGDSVTAEDIEAERAPRPKVLDMFAGGGAIPLEALRLGCEAYALELNPVAHIIELCTLVYPQKYGKPDPTVPGMTGPPLTSPEDVENTDDSSLRFSCLSGEDTIQRSWGGLAKEVEYWGKWVLERVRAEIGDLYPPIPDPENPPEDLTPPKQIHMEGDGFPGEQQPELKAAPGWLTPVAYLWTRTVKCKNPECGATVPLVRQTWLCRKKGRYVALRVTPDPKKKRVRFEVVESNANSEAKAVKEFGFDPASFSSRGNVACPFCGTVADSSYVKAEGCAKRMSEQMMAVVCTRPGQRGKVYLSADGVPEAVPDDDPIRKRIDALCERTGLTVPDEPLPPQGTLGFRVQPYGFRRWRDLFTERQLASLLGFAWGVRSASRAGETPTHAGRVGAVCHLAVYVDRAADHWSSLCAWNPSGEKLQHTFSRQALPMVWDFAEANPFGGSVGDWLALVENAQHGIWAGESSGPRPATVTRGSATTLPWPEATFDAVVTDPPYYDNVPYADLSDFFYVWLKRSLEGAYSDHLAAALTPKRGEIVAHPVRQRGDLDSARRAYESMMAVSLGEAARALKYGGCLALVYAHKTTLGWSTLVDALRRSGFAVTEAWPLDTELRTRLRGMDSAALASSIFLVARKREAAGTGSYERDVGPELDGIVRERVDTLWKMGISGADLVIAAVGAGLRAYTQFERVEYDNGEEVPAEQYLAEVEGVVLDTVLERIFGLSAWAANAGMPKSGISAVDPATRFYLLWRFTYGRGQVDAGEAIVFAYPQGVELDGPLGLAARSNPLLEKRKSKYRLRDFTERGEDETLGLPLEQSAVREGEPARPRRKRGRRKKVAPDQEHLIETPSTTEDSGPTITHTAAPLIDVLHRVLWLMEKRSGALPDYLNEVQPNTEQLRLVAHALVGPALERNGKAGTLAVSGTEAEQSALRKLTQNWRSLVEENLFRSGRT